MPEVGAREEQVQGLPEEAMAEYQLRARARLCLGAEGTACWAQVENKETSWRPQVSRSSCRCGRVAHYNSNSRHARYNNCSTLSLAHSESHFFCHVFTGNDKHGESRVHEPIYTLPQLLSYNEGKEEKEEEGAEAWVFQKSEFAPHVFAKSVFVCLDLMHQLLLLALLLL
jgi:hypothetical protein